MLISKSKEEQWFDGQKPLGQPHTGVPQVAKMELEAA